MATAWRRRGRAGPPALLMLLGERVDHRLPRSWFQRLAKGVLARAGVRLVDEYPVRDGRGILLAELDLADPERRVGVECQSWQWHATPTAQHRDARRRGTLRAARLGDRRRLVERPPPPRPRDQRADVPAAVPDAEPSA